MTTLLLLLRATYIWVLFFTHIPFMVNHAFNAMPMERLQHCNFLGGFQISNIKLCCLFSVFKGACSGVNKLLLNRSKDVHK